MYNNFELTVVYLAHILFSIQWMDILYMYISIHVCPWVQIDDQIDHVFCQIEQCDEDEQFVNWIEINLHKFLT
jgi:hypothetical protein